VDPRGQHGLHGRWYLQRLQGGAQAIGPPLAHQRAGLDQRLDALLQEERIALGPRNQALLERPQAGLLPQEVAEQFQGILRPQGVEPQLDVRGLAPPAMLVLRAVGDEQEQPRRGQALHQAVEEGLGLRIDPMQVLAHQEERLHLALAQQQTLYRVQDVLTALDSVEMLPCRVLDRYFQQRQEGWQRRPERRIERAQRAGDLLTDAARIIALFNLEIDVEK